MLTMSTIRSFSEKSWNSSEDYEDDNSSSSSPVQRRINNNEIVEMNGNSVITTHCVSTVIKPGDKQLHDPLQFVKIKSTELSQKAKEQIKLAEEVKITKEKIKEVEEEWQSNLLSWKSKRKQSKRNNEEEFEEPNSINQRKIKTFNEILHEKAKSGHRIGYNLHHYLTNEEGDNLIDNKSNHDGLSTDQIDHSEKNQNEQQKTDQHSQLNDNRSNENRLITNSPKEFSSNNLSQNKNAQNNQTNNYQINNYQINNYSLNNYQTNNYSSLSNNSNTVNYSSREDKKSINQLNNSQNLLNSDKNYSSNNSINSSINSSSNSSCKLINNKKTIDLKTNENREPQDESKKLSFKAKLSAFESLAKTEPKKPLEKTPPVKNKLRMSSSNNLITDRKTEEQETNNNFSKRFTSKSNENLSKFKSNLQDKDNNVNTKLINKRDLNSTKSESNLQFNAAYEQLNKNQEQTQSDQHLNDQHLNDQNLNDQHLNDQHSNHKNSTDQQTIQSDQLLNDQHLDDQSDRLIKQEINNQSDLLNTRSSNETIPNTINNLQQFDCDYEVSELSKRMQQNQISTSLDLLDEQPNLTHSSNHSNNYHPTIHSIPHQFSLDELSPTSNQMNNQLNNLQEPTNYFNDDYANSQLYNQQTNLTSHNIINNSLPTLQNDYSSGANQLYQAATNSNKQTISGPIIPQTAANYYDENVVGLYGNYYNTSNLTANAYQLQKNNRSTSSGHLEYPNGLPEVTNNQVYYHKPAQSYSSTQLMTRQSQPQLNMISSANPLTRPTQSYNYNHWLIQEAELRRQIDSRNGSSLIASTKNLQQPNLLQTNVYKDDQPVYENTIMLKKQQQMQQLSSNNIPYLGNNQQPQINKPPYPNPAILNNLGNNQTSTSLQSTVNQSQQNYLNTQQQKQQKQILSVSGKKKCSNCGDELGRGCAAMVIETLSLYYHINCFRCSVCHIILGNGRSGTDVRIRNQKLHCYNCYSNDAAGLKFSRV